MGKKHKDVIYDFEASPATKTFKRWKLPFLKNQNDEMRVSFCININIDLLYYTDHP